MSFEYKFLISSKKELDEIMNFCKEEGAIDQHCYGNGRYEITSIYKLFRTSDESALKVRLREYFHGAGRDYFIEEKIRTSNGITKHRMRISKSKFEQLKNCANEKELFLILDELGFRLSIVENIQDEFETYYINYVRTPWNIHLNDHTYRVTVDQNINAMINNQVIELLGCETGVLEIKGENEANDIIEFFMRTFSINVQKESKYKLAKREMARLTNK